MWSILIHIMGLNTFRQVLTTGKTHKKTEVSLFKCSLVSARLTAPFTGASLNYNR